MNDLSTAQHDWAAIREDYEAGVLPISTILRKYNVSRSALDRKRNRDGWNRQTNLLIKQEVMERLQTGENPIPAPDDVIARTAFEHVLTVLNQRADIKKLRELVGKAAGKLEQIMDGSLPEDEGASAIVGRAGVVGAVDTLGSALQRLIPLERSALGIDLTQPSGDANLGSGDGTSVTFYLPNNHRDPKPE